MKNNKLNRKLSLGKKTIAKLGRNEMSQIQGGAFTDGCTDGCGPLQTAWNCTYQDCTVNCTTGNNTNVQSGCEQSRNCDYSKGSICLCGG
ncbi:class I lanthipeptide [Echinicola marina]|uniref:class I lanthipeptide n=1 Tax=Echinicola marina TaxID=2859768 RepID=UPI001CF65B7C|nr:class I lanthipeptide [Echinicola marina]UCS92404.1 class I lanthipeptide [Echinicola marina]